MFVFFMGDGDADATAPQLPPDVATAIRLLTHHATRTLLRSATATAFDRTTGHEGFKSNGFMTLSRGQYEGHQLLVACRSQMDFGAEAPLAATQSFGFSSFGRTGRVLVSSNDGAIDIVNCPVHLARGIGLLLDDLKEMLPDAGLAPAIEAAGHGAPGAIVVGQITPGCTGTKKPQDAVEDASMV